MSMVELLHLHVDLPALLQDRVIVVATSPSEVGVNCQLIVADFLVFLVKRGLRLLRLSSLLHLGFLRSVLESEVGLSLPGCLRDLRLVH
jgi:hypothetical protein